MGNMVQLVTKITLRQNTIHSVHSRLLIWILFKVCECLFEDTWYLSEEMVPLALCDDETSDEETADIVIGMLNAGRPQQFAPGKPVMKTHLLDSQPVEEIWLRDFVGKRSTGHGYCSSA